MILSVSKPRVHSRMTRELPARDNRNEVDNRKVASFCKAALLQGKCQGIKQIGLIILFGGKTYFEVYAEMGNL